MFDKFDIEPKIRCQWESDDQAIEGVVHSTAGRWSPITIFRRIGHKVCTLPLPSGWVAPYTIAAVTRPHRATTRRAAAGGAHARGAREQDQGDGAR